MKYLSPKWHSQLCYLNRLFSLLVMLSFVLQITQTKSSFAYVRSVTEAGTEAHWFTRCVPIWLSQTGSRQIPMVEVERDLDQSLKAWDQVTCSSLSFQYQGLTLDTFIGFDPTPYVENQNIVIFQSGVGDWIHDPRAVGLTTVTMCQNDTTSCAMGTILDADIELNEVGFELTSSSNPNIRMDLANTLTHELGHLLGLDHSSTRDSTMYAEAPLGETRKRTLSRDDEAGVCDIFPSNSPLLCVVTSYDLMSGPPTESTEGVDESTVSATPSGCMQKTLSSSYLLNLSNLINFLLLLTMMFVGVQLRKRLNVSDSHSTKHHIPS